MSTPQERLPNNPNPVMLDDQFSSNTSMRSIMMSEEQKVYRPEDLRSRRFGYNPGWEGMMMPANLCGLQTGRVLPGRLTLFETGPLSVQNWSVDAQDPSPPNLMGELLAGSQVQNLLMWYEVHGFREIDALRTMEDAEAREIFTAVHPLLKTGVGQGAIEPCVYDLDVCITCRGEYLKQVLKAVPAGSVFQSAAERLIESVTAGKTHMKNMWGTWITEMAARRTPGGRGIAELTEDNLCIMRQIHQRTPDEREFEKINMTTAGLKEAMDNQTKLFAEILGKRENDEADKRELQAVRDELAETRRLMAEQSKMIQKMLEQNGTKKKVDK